MSLVNDIVIPPLLLPLRDDQKRFADAAIRNKGQLLIAEPGWGKTATCVYAVNKILHQDPSAYALIISPTGITSNFNKEAAKFGLSESLSPRIVCYGIDALLAHMFPRTRAASAASSIQAAASQDSAASKKRVRKTPLPTLQKVMDLKADTLFHLGIPVDAKIVLVLDEVHILRNGATLVGTTLRYMASWFEYRIAVSATPMINGVGDLSNIMAIVRAESHLLDPELLKTWAEPNATGQMHNGPLLSALCTNYVFFGRMDRSDFPEVVFQEISIPMTDEEYKRYRQIELAVSKGFNKANLIAFAGLGKRKQESDEDEPESKRPKPAESSASSSPSKAARGSSPPPLRAISPSPASSSAAPAVAIYREIIDLISDDEEDSADDEFVDHELSQPPSQPEPSDDSDSSLEQVSTDSQLAALSSDDDLVDSILDNTQKDNAAFFFGLRRFLNSMQSSDPSNEFGMSRKMEAILKTMKKHAHGGCVPQTVIYSNFVEHVLKPLGEVLQKGFPASTIDSVTGDITHEKKRMQVVNRYNSAEVNTLLISPAAGFGLDLANTAVFFEYEPPWNTKKSEQARGRTARCGSHKNLPPERRKVYQYLLVVDKPDGVQDGRPSIDRYMINLGMKKEAEINRVIQLLENEFLNAIAPPAGIDYQALILADISRPKSSLTEEGDERDGSSVPRFIHWKPLSDEYKKLHQFFSEKADKWFTHFNKSSVLATDIYRWDHLRGMLREPISYTASRSVLFNRLRRQYECSRNVRQAYIEAHKKHLIQFFALYEDGCARFNQMFFLTKHFRAVKTTDGRVWKLPDGVELATPTSHRNFLETFVCAADGAKGRLCLEKGMAILPDGARTPLPVTFVDLLRDLTRLYLFPGMYVVLKRTVTNLSGTRTSTYFKAKLKSVQASAGEIVAEHAEYGDITLTLHENPAHTWSDWHTSFPQDSEYISYQMLNSSRFGMNALHIVDRKENHVYCMSDLM